LIAVIAFFLASALNARARFFLCSLASPGLVQDMVRGDGEVFLVRVGGPVAV
jgi:hypothetical protein